MKLKQSIKEDLTNVVLKYFEQTKADEFTIKTLKMILDESISEKVIQKQVLELKKVVEGVESDKATHDAECLLGICISHGIGIAQDLKQEKDLQQEKDQKQAKMLFLKAAGKGSALAKLCLARMFKSNEVEAEHWYREAAEAGLEQAQYELGIALEAKKETKKEGMEWIKKAAVQGHMWAQHQLGMSLIHLNHKKDTKEKKEGVEWIQKAALQGFSQSQWSMANWCEQGFQQIPKDLKKAEEWYRKAAEQGDSFSQYFLGKLLMTEFKEEREGIEWIYKAAIANLPFAVSRVADMYACGNSIFAKDGKMALSWLTKAAVDGDPHAQTALGFAYLQLRQVRCLYSGDDPFETFDIVPEMPERASLLFQSASLSGHRAPLIFDNPNRAQVPRFSTLEAAFNFYKDKDNKAMMGFCYQFGFGVAQDIKKAIECYKQAIATNVPCFRDLYDCYSKLQTSYPEREFIPRFFQYLEKQKLSQTPQIKNEALEVLGFIHEYGAPKLSRNLLKAAKYYEEIISGKKLENYIASKLYFSSHTKLAFQAIKSICDVQGLPKDLSMLILDYACAPRNIVNFDKFLQVLAQCHIDKDSDSPEPELALRRVSAAGKLAAVKTLLEVVKDLDIDQAGPSGKNALMFSKQYNRKEVSEFLIKKGAKP